MLTNSLETHRKCETFQHRRTLRKHRKEASRNQRFDSNRSYAEVAQQATQQTTPTPNTTRQPTTQEIKEKRQKHNAELKRERAKLEITLTMSDTEQAAPPQREMQHNYEQC